MKLAFITDNGFYENNGMNFFSIANLQHITTMNNHFEEIIVVAQKTEFDGSNLELPSSNKLILVNRRGENLVQQIKRAVKDCDMVINFGFNGLIGQFFAKKYKKKSIFYVGGCYYDIWRNIGSYKKYFLAPFLKVCFKKAIKRADYVQYVDQYLIERYPPNKFAQILVCPSARVSINYENLQRRLKKPIIKPYKLGLIGYTHNKIKGIDTAIKAIALCNSDVILEVVGRGDTTELEKLAISLDIELQVKFLGVMSDREQLFMWLNSLDLYLQPSLTEGLPRATLEAMSTGCPVISSSAGGLKTLVPEKQRIEYGDFKLMATKIDNVLANAEDYKTIVRETFEKAASYSFDKLDERRNYFYAQIVEDDKKDD
ncbi:glycosyltransferase family 4 protein [Solibacillus sp. FSL H8-0523]|uniref:glycosyltransferase family 4 protein n=1 Tax=Solibacillus sp. FSL H8-0523 TaxID=2954511 RepID=UPI003101314D